MITTFKQLEEKVKSLPPATIVIAAAEDKKNAGLARLAREKGFIKKAILTGNSDQIKTILNEINEPLDFYEIIDCPDDRTAAIEAVKAVREGRAQILVKGRLETVYYLKAILDKENGVAASKVLSNLTMLEMPSYHKFICVTDNAIMPLPNVEEKKLIALNVAPLMKAIEVDNPKVAALSALEVVNPKVPSTVDADALQAMSRNGEMGNFIVEGPIAYDIAISKEASAGKKHVSEVAGEPDILLMPNLEAANILTKAYKFHAQANSGGLVMGAKVPVVLNSRSDDSERRLNSLMMAMGIHSVS